MEMLVGMAGAGAGLGVMFAMYLAGAVAVLRVVDGWSSRHKGIKS